MTVFSAFFHIYRKNFFVTSLYFLIFSTILFFMTSANAGAAKFTPESPKIYLEEASFEAGARSTPAALQVALKSYLRRFGILQKMTKEEAFERLSAKYIDGIVEIVPKKEGNGEAGFEVLLHTSPDLNRKHYYENFLSKYLMMLDAKLFHETGNRMEEANYDSLIQYGKEVETVLARQADVVMVDRQLHKESALRLSLSTATYPLSAMILLIYSIVSKELNDAYVTIRRKLSSLGVLSYHFQTLLSFEFITLLTSAAFFTISVFLTGVRITTLPLLYFLTLVTFSISISALALFLHSMTSSPKTVRAVTTLLTLGTSFISGAFVPSQFLPDFLVKLSKFYPSYYFIEALKTGNFLYNNLVMILFTVFFIILTLYRSNKKQESV